MSVMKVVTNHITMHSRNFILWALILYSSRLILTLQRLTIMFAVDIKTSMNA